MRWYVKASIQWILSRLPGGLRINEALSRRMGEQADLSIHVTDRLGVLLKLIRTAGRHIDFSKGPVAAEVGTGWAPLLPILLGFAGARTLTFDVNRFLVPANIRTTLTILGKHSQTVATELGCTIDDVYQRIESALTQPANAPVEALLEPFHVTYTAPVTGRPFPLEEGSLDMFVSNLVLAHVPADVMPDFIREMHRVMKDGAIAVHRIRMSDEFAGGDPRVHDMNFLRFSSKFWNRFANTRIKYNNRLRCSQYKKAFEECGFELLESEENVSQEGLEGLKSMQIADEFQGFELEDLATALMLGVWRKKAPVHARSAR
jgi:SAM-dependent methyltransferase